MFGRFFVFAFVLVFPLGVAAQSGSGSNYEIFAGYSILKTNYEPETPNPPAPVITAFNGKQTMQGVHGSVTGYLNSGFGLTGELSMHFKNNSIADPLGGTIDTKIRVTNVLGGGQYKFNRGSEAAPFIRALAGVANTNSTLSLSRTNSSGTSSSTDLALAIGGGLDVAVSDHIDVRVFQVDYNPIFLRRGNELGFGKTRADNIRFSFGLVFK